MRSASAEQEGAFARIEAVNVGVGDIVPAVNDQAQRKCHIKQSQPECYRVEDTSLAERKQIEPDRSEPEARTGSFDDEGDSRSAASSRGFSLDGSGCGH